MKVCAGAIALLMFALMGAFPGNNRARRVDIVKVARLADLGTRPENSKNT